MENDKEIDILELYGLNKDISFRYMLLGRMQADCEYYLNYGNRNSKQLWFINNEKEHIKIMYALYDSLPDKPKWCTLEQIDNYAKQMIKQ